MAIRRSPTLVNWWAFAVRAILARHSGTWQVPPHALTGNAFALSLDTRRYLRATACRYNTASPPKAGWNWCSPSETESVPEEVILSEEGSSHSYWYAPAPRCTLKDPL